MHHICLAFLFFVCLGNNTIQPFRLKNQFDHVRVKPSIKFGYGLFAEKRLEPGTLVGGEYVGRVLTDKESDKVKQRNGYYYLLSSSFASTSSAPVAARTRSKRRESLRTSIRHRHQSSSRRRNRLVSDVSPIRPTATPRRPPAPDSAPIQVTPLSQPASKMLTSSAKSILQPVSLPPPARRMQLVRRSNPNNIEKQTARNTTKIKLP